MSTQTTRLKNGAEEATVLVVNTTLALQNLMEQDPVLLYELVMACRDRSHRLFGNAGERLQRLGLLTMRDDGRAEVHDSIRNIVLSGVSGEGFDLALGSPIAE